MSQDRTAKIIAEELKVHVSQVKTAINLLDDGATVPFIARYRKEATKGLNDTQLRVLVERLYFIRELDERRTWIINKIREQGKLTNKLEQLIQQAQTKSYLEDLYLPYRSKRHTKAQIAKEAGLEPLAVALLQDPNLTPLSYAQQFLNSSAEINDVQTALEGAKQILMEKFAEDAELLKQLREYLWVNGMLHSIKRPTSLSSAQSSKFANYFSYSQSIKAIPSHRALALFRGQKIGILKLTLTLPEHVTSGEELTAKYFHLTDQNRPADRWLIEAAHLAWNLKIASKLEKELFKRLHELADNEAIKVFACNLKKLLLAAPAGPCVIMGLDPGLRTGVKVVVIDTTGKLLDYTTIFPFSQQNNWHASISELAKLAIKYAVKLISIGNGTGSRETSRLVTDLLKMYPDLQLEKVIVNESGASIYSASELAANELPDLDVSWRGAVSIARRLQDPLAELVKIEPKSIGVGQYQHDVDQTRLKHTLEGVVEDCVNQVGVDINQASICLLTHISGLNETLARNLVQYRNEHGRFANREQLKNVARMGDKSFQQAAGFLRIMHGENMLDATAIHPEAYYLVEKILSDSHIDLHKVMQQAPLLQHVDITKYVDENYGVISIQEILKELEKPGRDPRPEFKVIRFKDDIEDIKDLSPGMVLNGVVSNVTNFGAFVDLGIHQDGLLHISEMNNQFTSNPHDLLKPGDIIEVKVIEVNQENRRISLSLRLEQNQHKISDSESHNPKSTESLQKKSTKTMQVTNKFNIPKITNHKALKKLNYKNQSTSKQTKVKIFNTAMADAFAKIKKKN